MLDMAEFLNIKDGLFDFEVESCMKYTPSAKKEGVTKIWYHIDAEGQTLGRLATRVATILRGKNKPIFTPHVDTGDFVVITNAEKIQLTGNKWEEKEYKHYSGYPSGLKSMKAKDMLVKKPEEIIKHAVKGMLPRGPLGRKTFKKLKVYAGVNHPHTAQQPVKLEL